MPIILECVLRAGAGNETRTERESGTQKVRARGQSVRDVGIFRLLTGVCEVQILGVTIVTTIICHRLSRCLPQITPLASG